MANRRLRLIAGTLVLAFVVGYLSYLNRRFQLDDALIYQRYFRNFLDGHGLVFNLGERVNALTSPLFSYLSIATSYVVGNVALASVIISGATIFLALAVWWRVFSDASSPKAAISGVGFALLFPYLYVTFGMETCLFLLLLGLCLVLFEAGEYFWLAVAAALLVLTRPEGVFLLIALAGEHYRQGRPNPDRQIWILPTAVLAAHFTFNWLYYGSPISDSATVKIIQGRSGFWGPWPPIARVGYQLDWFFSGDRVRAAALFFLAIFGAAGALRSTLFRVSTLFLILLTGFYVAFSLPNYHWYYAPYYMIGLFWAGAGAVRLWRLARRLANPFVRGVATLVVAGFIMVLLAQGVADTLSTIRRSSASHPYRQIGEWLVDNSNGDASVAAMEIGFLGWYSNRYLIDIVGLVTPENARFLAKGRYGAWLDHSDPDYIVTHNPRWPLERAAAAASRSGEYRPVAGVDVAGFQLLERAPDTGLGSVENAMNRLRHRPYAEFRSEVLEAVLAGQLGPTVPLGVGLVAANLSPDRWTRGTTPAAIVVWNEAPNERKISLRLTCLADSSKLPVTTFIDDGNSVQEIRFNTAGSRTVDLESIPSGSTALIAVWTDKAWQPPGRDNRWLGVNIDSAD